LIVEAMKIYVDPVTETEIISDSYPTTFLFEDTTAEIQSRMVVIGDVNVDVGCGNAFGGANEEEEEGGPAAPTVAKVNDLIDAFGYIETSYDKKDWQAYFKGYVKPILEKMTANKSPRLDAFKKGAGAFVKYISEKFNDITIYTPKDGSYDGALIYSYWKDEEDEAPVFLFFLEGLKTIKV